MRPNHSYSLPGLPIWNKKDLKRRGSCTTQFSNGGFHPTKYRMTIRPSWIKGITQPCTNREHDSFPATCKQNKLASTQFLSTLQSPWEQWGFCLSGRSVNTHLTLCVTTSVLGEATDTADIWGVLLEVTIAPNQSVERHTNNASAYCNGAYRCICPANSNQMTLLLTPKQAWHEC